MASESILHITAPHFCAGAVYDESGRITDAAPIIRYMVGWSVERARSYAARKGWSVESGRPERLPPNAEVDA